MSWWFLHDRPDISAPAEKVIIYHLFNSGSAGMPLGGDEEMLAEGDGMFDTQSAFF
jgi:hypothetical protein